MINYLELILYSYSESDVGGKPTNRQLHDMEQLNGLDDDLTNMTYEQLMSFKF
jgi:hypothetical protein